MSREEFHAEKLFLVINLGQGLHFLFVKFHRHVGSSVSPMTTLNIQDKFIVYIVSYLVKMIF